VQTIGQSSDKDQLIAKNKELEMLVVVLTSREADCKNTIVNL